MERNILYFEPDADQNILYELAKRFDFNAKELKKEEENRLGYCLVLNKERLALVYQGEEKRGDVSAEFVEGAARHRRLQGGGAGQAIAKAVGIKGSFRPRVIDATAGLGRDAFVLASLGCEVMLIERSPIAAALLWDGLRRAERDFEASDIRARMTLLHGDAVSFLQEEAVRMFAPDVVLLDPMFPEKTKTALAGKEMQAFQALLGGDRDADKLLAPALAVAKKRVVVKRPKKAPFLAHVSPSSSLEGQSTRFDFYLPWVNYSFIPVKNS